MRQVPVVGMQRRDILVVGAADLAAPARQVEAEQRHAFLDQIRVIGREVGLPRPHPAGLQRRAEARFALAQQRVGLRALGDIDAEDEDAGDVPAGVLDRLVDEVDEARSAAAPPGADWTSYFAPVAV